MSTAEVLDDGGLTEGDFIATDEIAELVQAEVENGVGSAAVQHALLEGTDELRIHPLSPLELTDRERAMLTNMIASIPVGEWFQRKHVDVSGITFVSPVAFEIAFVRLKDILLVAEVIEHNGKGKSQSAYRFTKAYGQHPTEWRIGETSPPLDNEPETLSDELKQPPSKARIDPISKSPKPKAENSFQDNAPAALKTKTSKKTEAITAASEHLADRRKARRREQELDEEERAEANQSQQDQVPASEQLTLEEMLQNFLDGKSDFPEGLESVDRYKIRAFLREASTMRKDVAGYHMRHRQLQVWLNPQLAQQFNIETGAILRPPI